MLKNLVFGMIFIGLSANGFTASSSPELSHGNQKLVIDKLNDICGDTWCEGEFDINFTAFNVKFNSSGIFVLKFIASRENENKTVDSRFVSCEIKETEIVQKFIESTTLLPDSQNEMQFYRLVDRCLSDMLN